MKFTNFIKDKTLTTILIIFALATIEIFLLAYKGRTRYHERKDSYCSRSGENRTKADVKLACKTIFVWFSTSGGHPEQ